MARPLRLEIPGALYHVTLRGDRKEAIYESDDDRTMFLAILATVCRRDNWVLHAYCLMDNHYHLLVETPDGNLSRGMQYLNGVYTQRFNRIHQRVGHVFQGRYHVIFVDRDSYLLELMRYIVLNPVRSGQVDHPADWEWSSYQATAGMVNAPTWLATHWTLSLFARRGADGRNAYEQFVAAGIGHPGPWAHVKHKFYLGPDEFVKTMRSQHKPKPKRRGAARPQRPPPPETLAAIALRCDSRDEAIFAAYNSGCFTLQDIGTHFGLHGSRISRIIKKQKDARGLLAGKVHGV